MPAEDQVLQAMMAHWIHEDGLFWSQFRNLLTTEAVFLGAWFFLKPGWLALIVMLLACFTSYLLFRLANAVRKNRDINCDVMKKIASEITSSWLGDQIRDIRRAESKEETILLFADHSLKGRWDKGNQFQNMVFTMAMITNGALSLLTLMIAIVPDGQVLIDLRSIFPQLWE